MDVLLRFSVNTSIDYRAGADKLQVATVKFDSEEHLSLWKDKDMANWSLEIWRKPHPFQSYQILFNSGARNKLSGTNLFSCLVFCSYIAAKCVLLLSYTLWYFGQIVVLCCSYVLCICTTHLYLCIFICFYQMKHKIEKHRKLQIVSNVIRIVGRHYLIGYPPEAWVYGCAFEGDIFGTILSWYHSLCHSLPSSSTDVSARK